MPAHLGDRILANAPTAGWLGFEFRLLLSAKRPRRGWDYLRFFELGFARLGALSWLTAFAGGEGGIDFALLSPAALASLVWLEPFGGPWVQIPPFTCREAAPERVGFEPTDGFPSSVFKTIDAYILQAIAAIGNTLVTHLGLPIPYLGCILLHHENDKSTQGTQGAERIQSTQVEAPETLPIQAP